MEELSEHRLDHLEIYGRAHDAVKDFPVADVGGGEPAAGERWHHACCLVVAEAEDEDNGKRKSGVVELRWWSMRF